MLGHFTLRSQNHNIQFLVTLQTYFRWNHVKVCLLSINTQFKTQFIVQVVICNSGGTASAGRTPKGHYTPNTGNVYFCYCSLHPSRTSWMDTWKTHISWNHPSTAYPTFSSEDFSEHFLKLEGSEQGNRSSTTLVYSIFMAFILWRPCRKCRHTYPRNQKIPKDGIY